MKRFLSFILMVGMTLVAYAQSRSVDDAMHEAQAFLYASTNSAHRVQSNATLSLAYTLPRIDGNAPAAYLFQLSDERGYVLVSAEKQARTILAYAEEGRFDPIRIPANMQVWLQHYAEEIAWAATHGTVTRTEVGTEGTAPQRVTKKIEGERIDPLLGDIVWSQDAPFWDGCPDDSDGNRSYSGCVATATAQIMRYWKTPTVGSGWNAYEWVRSDGSTQELSANFAQHTYDWDNMIGDYSQSYTKVQGDAVALLLSDIGIATNMAYSSVGSGTQTEQAARALYTYFGYDKTLRAVRPDYVGNEAFAEQMLTELQERRPVLMSGATANDEGHAFVCDGYDGDGFFHINWGWGGFQNEYFALTALDPAEQGIGGAASGQGFSVRVLGVMGIKPDEGGEVETHVALGTHAIELYADKEIARDDAFDVTVDQIHSNGFEDFEGGIIGLAVMDDDDNIVGWHSWYRIGNLPVASYFPDKYVFQGNLEDVAEDGVYRLKLLYMNEYDAEEVLWDVEVGYDSPKEFVFTVSGNTVTFAGLEEDNTDYSVKNLQASTEGNTVLFSFECAAPFFEVKMYNEETQLVKAIIDFNSGQISDVPSGVWTLSVQPYNSMRTRYLADASTVTVTVGEVVPQEVTLRLLVNDETMGSVSGTGVYQSGDEVQISATANEGYEFVNWSDGDTNATRTLTLERTGDAPRTMTLTANFQKVIDYNIYNLQTYTEGSDIHFTFESEAPYYYAQVYNDEMVYAKGVIDYKEVVVRDVPDGEWTIAVYGVDETKTYIMSDALTVTVTIDVPQEVTVELLANDDMMGKVYGSGSYQSGQTVHIEAVAEEGYRFVKWSDDVEDATRDIVLEKTERAPRTLTLTAIFEGDSLSGVGNSAVSKHRGVRKSVEKGSVVVKTPHRIYDSHGRMKEVMLP